VSLNQEITMGRSAGGAWSFGIFDTLWPSPRRGLKTAAKQRLHTAQPSLSRQIRELEAEVGD
jgi:hypothetical protein